MNFRSLPTTTNQALWRHKTTFDYLFAASLVALVIFTFTAQGLAFAQGPPDSVASEQALGNSPFANQLSDEEPMTVTGILNVLIEDDFANKRSRRFYSVKDARTQETHKLRFTKKAPGHLRAGATVTARGRSKGGELYLAMDASGTESIETILPAQVAVSGEQKTLVMAVNFPDASLSCSVADIEDLMFTDPADNSIDDLYTETSFGAIWFTGDVVGTYTIEESKDVCNIEAWAEAADEAARADGIDPGNYNRKVYVLPPGACPGSGYGTVGGTPSRAWIFTCDLADVFAHELGHNLGMGHAATLSYTYGDTSDIMGLGGGDLRQVNAPHKEQMGWLPPEQVATVTDSGIYEIAPLESDPFVESLAPQTLKIHKVNTNEYYYLSYRRAIGFDANLAGSAYLDHVNVHRYAGDGSGSTTYILDALADGDSFVDSVNNITISQISHSDAYATVQVQMDSSCTVAEPIVDISPASQNASPGTTLDYTVVVTNTDSASCGASTFLLSASLPEGWAATLAEGLDLLAPGQSATATLSVTSPEVVTEASYGLKVDVTDAEVPVHTSSVSASYVVEATCQPGTPVAWISPASQSAAGGTLLDYTISVTNGDSPNCPASSFSLNAELPADWTGVNSPITLTLNPSQTGTATVSVTSPADAAAGGYAIKVTVTDVPEPLIAYYVVEAINVGDTEAPSVPTDLTAAKAGTNVKLAWNAATDNVGVTGYEILRNGERIGDTTETKLTVSAPPAGTTYSYSVSAYDAAGLMSAPSSEATVTTVEKTNQGKPKK